APGVYTDTREYQMGLSEVYLSKTQMADMTFHSPVNVVVDQIPVIKPATPVNYLPIGTTVYALNHQYQFGSPEEVVAKIIDSSEFNRGKRKSTHFPWYMLAFANGAEDHVNIDNVIPTSEYFIKYCELYPHTVYRSNVDCGELFSSGESFILRDRYLFNRNNQ